MKKWLTRAILTLGLLAAVTLSIIWGEWKYTKSQGQKRLAQVRAKLDAEEPGWRLEDLIAKHNASLPPDEENLAVVVEKQVKKKPKNIADLMISQNADSFLDSAISHQVDPILIHEFRIKLKPFLEQYDPFHGRPHLKSDGIPILQKDDLDTGRFFAIAMRIREMSHFLTWKVRLRIADGELDLALETCLSALRLRNALSNVFCRDDYYSRIGIIHLAIRDVERTISMGDVSRKLDLLQSELLLTRSENNLLAVLNGERAMFDQDLCDITSGKFGAVIENGGLDLHPGLLKKMKFAWFLKDVELAHSQLLNQMQFVFDSRQRSGTDRHQVFTQLGTAVSKTAFDNYVDFSLPRVKKILKADLQLEGHLNCAITAIACERFRQQSGRWPTTLDEIPKSILPEHPIDPKDGSPVKLVRTEHGLNVAVMGYDWVFHGGKKLGYRPDEDLGFELFDPEFRNRPPLPIKPTRDGDETPPKKNPYVPEPLQDEKP